ncbi:hypothetical protein BS78_05G241600 [Paspalum vaginatum]|nr:hypothetical protein BS78_05G241600 [Paspalum vaginatum]
MELVKGDDVSAAGTMSANVVYNGSSKLMLVSLRDATGRPYSINRTVDFIDASLPVPEGVAIGFAAAAAANIESNQLLSWSFSSTDPTRNGSRMTQLWVIILALAAVMLVGFVAALLCVTLRRR